MRRAGPYQLALLSHLRRDDKILPVMKAVWHHSLHSSCPDQTEVTEGQGSLVGSVLWPLWRAVADSSQSNKGKVLWPLWREVADSLLSNVLGSASSGQRQPVLLLSLRYATEVPSMMMPGSAALMQIIFPQLQHIQELPHDLDFLQVLRGQLVRLTALLQRCLPTSLYKTLEVDGKHMMDSRLWIGTLGEDVLTEISVQACASAQDWPGILVFESVRSHLWVLVSTVMSHIAETDRAHPHADPILSGACEAFTALAPAVLAVLLRPISQAVASLQVKFAKEGTCFEWSSFLPPLLSPFPQVGIWQFLRERSIQAVLQLHAAEFEAGLCTGSDAQENEEDPKYPMFY